MTDAIEMLEADHREVEGLFAALEDLSGVERQQTVNKLAKSLSIHAQIEEEVMYPAMKDAGLDDEVKAATEEHQKVKDLVAQLEEVDPSSDVDALMAELEADVTHHVEEEESEVFPKFRDAVDQVKLDELGVALVEAKESAMQTQEPRQSRTSEVD